MVMREALEEGIFPPTEHITMTGPRLDLKTWMEKVSIQRDGLRGDGLHDAFTVEGGKGGGGICFASWRLDYKP